jgi:transposase
VIHGDDAGVKLRVEGAGRARKAHLWACIGDADRHHVAFEFAAGYTAEGPEEFLEGYKIFFQADALRLPKRTRRGVP